MKIGDRVKTKHDFLSNGVIFDEIREIGLSDSVVFYQVMLDEKAPNEYAYNTDMVLLSPDEIELEKAK